MTEADARALNPGDPVTDGGAGVGTVYEVRVDNFSVKWTAPPERVEGVSVVDFDDPQLHRWTFGPQR